MVTELQKPTSTDLDRVSGTRLGTLWFLPCFSVVGFAVAWAPGAASPDVFWLGLSAITLAAFVWAWWERRLSRRLLRALIGHGENALIEGRVHNGGQHFGADTKLVQYRVVISLLLVEIKFTTAPRVNASSLAPNLVTLLLGWWGIPFGPVHTVGALVANVKGGQVRTPADFLRGIATTTGPRAAWWRRTLALDTKSVGQVALNLAIALVLGVLAALLMMAYVRSR